MDDVVYQLPPHIELTRDEYRLVNAGLEAGLDACDDGHDAMTRSSRGTIEAALRLLAYRIWPDLAALDDEEDQ